MAMYILNEQTAAPPHMLQPQFYGIENGHTRTSPDAYPHRPSVDNAPGTANMINNKINGCAESSLLGVSAADWAISGLAAT